MKTPALTSNELVELRRLFSRHPEVKTVKLFGSRAKETNTANSDIDLAIWGQVGDLQAEAIAAELDELPMPYKYDVKPFDLIKLARCASTFSESASWSIRKKRNKPPSDTNYG